ncbi:MAG: hypothetical protein J0H86_03135 [Xanthomonadaceae bacterium]|nr:hypothetical protein [Xanthomonadaceae bacterium]
MVLVRLFQRQKEAAYCVCLSNLPGGKPFADKDGSWREIDVKLMCPKEYGRVDGERDPSSTKKPEAIDASVLNSLLRKIANSDGLTKCSHENTVVVASAVKSDPAWKDVKEMNSGRDSNRAKN